MKDTVAFEALHGSITTLIYIYKTGKKRAFSILHTPPIRVRITPSTGVPQHRLKRKKGSTHHAKPVIGYRDTLETVPYAPRRNLLIKTQCPRRKRGSSPNLGILTTPLGRKSLQGTARQPTSANTGNYTPR